MISCKEYASLKKEEYKNIDTKPCLNIFQIGEDFGSSIYIKNKIKDCEKINVPVIFSQLSENISQNDFNKILKSVSPSNKILVTLPLPKEITLLPDYISAEQDIDGIIHNLYPSCTAEGIIDWLAINNIPLKSKHVVIINRSELIGKSLAKMFLDKDATVSICHSYTLKGTLSSLVSSADIIISAIGKPKYFKWDLPISKYGEKIFIDVGINKDEENKLCGDFDYYYLTKQGHYVTPVPCGVGELTRVTLLKHLVKKYS